MIDRLAFTSFNFIQIIKSTQFKIKKNFSCSEQFCLTPSNIYVVLAGQTSETCAAKLQKYFFPVKPLFLSPVWRGRKNPHRVGKLTTRQWKHLFLPERHTYICISSLPYSTDTYFHGFVFVYCISVRWQIKDTAMKANTHIPPPPTAAPPQRSSLDTFYWCCITSPVFDLW